MHNAVLDDLESESGKKEEESGSETRECDNAWRLKSVSEEEFNKWEAEKERYDEVLEYIREVDEILDLIRPFPRDKVAGEQRQDLVRSDSSHSARDGLDHLENIVKIVEQLKELQENNSKLSERTCYLKDLKKLRELKRRLKNEELELKSRARSRSTASPEVFQEDFAESQSKARKISSTASEKLDGESEGWQHKRKSLCLPHVEGQNKSKVSKWTKVKEAFHWERTSTVSKSNKKELLPGEKSPEDGERADCPRDHSPDGSLLSAPDGFSPPLPPPPPPPPAPPRPPSLPLRSEDLLSVRPIQDFPSSSSSDRLEEFYSETLTKGNKTPDADSSSQVFIVDDNEDVDSVVRKSSSGEFPQHLSKEELTTRSTKSNKTTWGKVKDIIQTRKDSLKKKPKKRGSDEFKKRRKLSSLSTSQLSDPFDDLSSPEDKLKSLGDCIPKSGYDFPEDTTVAAQTSTECSKKLMPALTVTLPSTEELTNFSCEELKNEMGKPGQNQRLSRWIKVKRVFLTSGAPSRPPNYSPVNDSSPTSQIKSFGFFSDMESDDVSSGEWIDKSPSQEKSKLGELEAQTASGIQEDIRKSYNELQKKLSHEFDQKLREWGEMKSEGSGKQEESSPRPRRDDGGDSIPKLRKTRDSMPVPLPNLNDLSPEFKKKLNDWKKMKTSQSSSSVSSSATKEEVQGGQNIKIRIGEWQPWRSRGSQKGSAKPEPSEEGRSGGSRPPSTSRKEKDGPEGSTLRRNSKKRDSLKKISHSRTPSGGDSTTSTEKDGKFRRTPKVKDFQWVEKELQKIEREKLRLEQEREKYLEREARLEKMKRTMGTTCPTQEILVRTPAGFFRFKGISQKFTKKLYEWEKARGIAPEASTFALLEESAKTTVNGNFECEVGAPMQRSKSTGSVPGLSSTLLIQTIAHHPSSLSLNDVDDLKTREEDHELDDSISSERIKAESEEPEAIIVDVEDIEEETAMLAAPPSCEGQVPVYAYASQESDLVTDSSERFYFGGDVKIIEEAQICSGKQCEMELLENIQGSDFKFSSRKTTDEVFETSERTLEEKKLVGNDSNQNVLLMRNVKTFEDAQEVTRTTFEDAATTLDQKQQLHFLTNEELPQKEPSAIIAPESAAPPRLSKSSKTFFEWTSNSEVSCAKDSSEVSEDFKLSLGLGRSEAKISHDSVQTRSDPEALKRKIKEKITLMQRMSTEGKLHGWRHSDYNYARTNKEENGFRLGNEKKKEEEGVKIERGTDVVFTPKKEKFPEQKTTVDSETLPPVNVFVPTTRKIISPVQTTKGTTPSVFSYVIDDVKPEEPTGKPEVGHSKPNSTPERTHLSVKTASQPTTTPSDKSTTTLDKKRGEGDPEPEKKRDIGIPPLPNSPKSFKKLNAKETAPSIRMIIAKYNQKISEHDSASEKRTESGSPTIWRSPVFGRRTQEKIDQYKRNGEVQKSASLDNVRSIPQMSNLTPPPEHEPRIKGILKSSSVGVMKIRSQNSESGESTTSAPAANAPKETSPSALRALKIQKAKEDFLSGRLGASSEVSTPLETPKMLDPTEVLGKSPRIEVKVEDCDQSLIKSVSAETISSERGERTNGKSPEPRPLQKSSSKFDISSIKSKFRKIRMRKDKDPKLNAVAVLCRQSLFIEVPKSSEGDQASTSMSKSCPSSPIMDRNKPEKPNGSGEKKSKNR